MAMLAALGPMSVLWMSIVAFLFFVQKVLPPRASVDVPVALGIVARGIAVLTT
jgi:predicted metal-binding membrane protein